MSSFALTTIGVDVTKRAFIDINNVNGFEYQTA